MHKALFEKAKEAAEKNKDTDLGPIRVCELCGFTLEGEAPDPCPVCGAAKKKFSTFQ